MGLEASDRELQEALGALDDRKGYLRRDVLWEWALSRVERVHLDDGTSLIVKRSRDPLIDEGRILRHISGGDVPLPRLRHSQLRDGILTLVLEDLGPAAATPHCGRLGWRLAARTRHLRLAGCAF